MTRKNVRIIICVLLCLLCCTDLIGTDRIKTLLPSSFCMTCRLDMLLDTMDEEADAAETVDDASVLDSLGSVLAVGDDMRHETDDCSIQLRSKRYGPITCCKLACCMNRADEE